MSLIPPNIVSLLAQGAMIAVNEGPKVYRKHVKPKLKDWQRDYDNWKQEQERRRAQQAADEAQQRAAEEQRRAQQAAEEQRRAQQRAAEALHRRFTDFRNPGFQESGFPPVVPAVVPGWASPDVMRRAKELGVDLSKVKGSGPLGLITLEDVNKHSRM